MGLPARKAKNWLSNPALARLKVIVTDNHPKWANTPALLTHIFPNRKQASIVFSTGETAVIETKYLESLPEPAEPKSKNFTSVDNELDAWGKRLGLPKFNKAKGQLLPDVERNYGPPPETDEPPNGSKLTPKNEKQALDASQTCHVVTNLINGAKYLGIGHADEILVALSKHYSHEKLIALLKNKQDSVDRAPLSSIETTKDFDLADVRVGDRIKITQRYFNGHDYAGEWTVVTSISDGIVSVKMLDEQSFGLIPEQFEVIKAEKHSHSDLEESPEGTHPSVAEKETG